MKSTIMSFGQRIEEIVGQINRSVIWTAPPIAFFTCRSSFIHSFIHSFSYPQNLKRIGMANVFMRVILLDVPINKQVPIISRYGEVTGKLQLQVVLQRYAMMMMTIIRVM